MLPMRAVSDVLVKVYAPGRLLLLDLLRPVEDGAARVQVAQEDVRITLRKARAAHCPACARCCNAWVDLSHAAAA